MAPEMGNHIVVLQDAQGLVKIEYNTGTKSQTLATRGEVEPGTVINMVSVDLLMQILRKVGVWVVETKVHKPGG